MTERKDSNGLTPEGWLVLNTAEGQWTAAGADEMLRQVLLKLIKYDMLGEFARQLRDDARAGDPYARAMAGMVHDLASRKFQPK